MKLLLVNRAKRHNLAFNSARSYIDSLFKGNSHGLNGHCDYCIVDNPIGNCKLRLDLNGFTNKERCIGYVAGLILNGIVSVPISDTCLTTSLTRWYV